jgi:hypothetical protein
MLFVIDLDLLQVIKAATDKSAVVLVEGKRGDDSPFEVVFVRNGVAEELAGSSVLTFGAKQAGKYDGAAVVLNSDFTLSGSGTTAKYTANPSFNTTELNDLFLIDADDSNDPAYVDLMAEFTWQAGAGAPSSTKTFAFRVHNDVVRDSELEPTALPTPIGSTAPVNAAFASATSALPGSNDDVKFTAVASGTSGNSIQVIVVGSAELDISVSGNTITCYIDNGITTAGELVSAINAHGAASALIVAANAAGNDGSGAFIPSTYNLSGGVNPTLAPPYLRTAGGFLYIQEAGTWKKTALSAL